MKLNSQSYTISFIISYEKYGTYNFCYFFLFLFLISFYLSRYYLLHITVIFYLIIIKL